MISRTALKNLLNRLYRRRADIESLICFFEHYGKEKVQRQGRPKRELRFRSKLAATH